MVFKKTKLPIVSIIVPTKNSADNITLLLDSLVRQDFTSYEIIINDDVTSKDRLSDIVKNYAMQGLPVEYIKKNKSMAQGRAAGVLVSRGKILLHLDSDMQVNKGLIKECVGIIAKGIDAIVIPEESFGTTFWAKCKGLEKQIISGVDYIESARCMTRNAYEKIGGHDPKMVFSEDKDLDIRLRKAGFIIGRSKISLLHNEGSLKLMSTLRKKAGYSKTANIFKKKHPTEFRRQANLFLRYGRMLKRIDLIFSHPILYVGTWYMKTMEFLAGGIGILKTMLVSNRGQ